MAVSFNCTCPERRYPLQLRDWVVTQYRCHHSAFAGYHRTHSDYSTVACRQCGAVGRTKAQYVDELRCRVPSLNDVGIFAGRYVTPGDKEFYASREAVGLPGRKP